MCWDACARSRQASSVQRCLLVLLKPTVMCGVVLCCAVCVQAYLCWEQAGQPEGADFADQARGIIEERVRNGATYTQLARELNIEPTWKQVLAGRWRLIEVIEERVHSGATSTQLARELKLRLKLVPSCASQLHPTSIVS